MSTIQSLPPEMIQQICSYLVSYDVNNRDLVSFSSTCKRFRDLTFTYRYSSIHISIDSEKHLIETVDSIVKGIKGKFGVIQELKISGRMTGNPRHDTRQYPKSRTRSLDDGFEPCGHVDANGSLSHVPKSSNSLSSWQSLKYPELTPEECRVLGEAWRPLAGLIETIPNLRDLGWFCSNQVPHTVLEALHQHSPGTRLHVYSFNPGMSAVSTDGFCNGTYMLMMSPCLTTVVLSLVSENGTFCLILYFAYMSLLKFRAPNLQSVSVWSDTYVERDGVLLENLSEDPPNYLRTWRIITTDHATDASLAPARRDSLDTLVTFSPCTFALWARRHQTEWIRDLTFTCQLGWEMVKQLKEIVMGNGGYPSLEALRLRAYDEVRSSRSLDKQVSALLKEFRRLKTLELMGFIGGRTFRAALEKHGPSLKRFRYEPAFHDWLWRINRAGIRKLAKCCPELESLDISLHYAMSDSKKIKVCRVLRRLPRLRHVCLDMAFGKLSPPTPRRRHEERYHYEEEVGKKVLASSDSYGKSALAIFQAIGGDHGPLVDLRIHGWCSNFGLITQESDLRRPFWVGYTWVYQRACGGCDIYFQGIEKRKKPFCPTAREMPESDVSQAARGRLVEAVTKLARKMEKTAK